MPFAGVRVGVPGMGGGSFTPPALPGLYFWLDPTAGLFQELTGAAATTPAAADGDPVGTWRAAGPAGSVLQFVAPATASRPLLKLARLAGRPMVLGDGVDDKLLLSAGAAQAFTSLQVALVCEAALSGATTQNAYEFRDNAVGNTIAEQFKLTADTRWTHRTRDDSGAALVATPSTDAALAVYELDWDGSNQRTWENGVLAGGPTARAGAVSPQKYAALNHVLDVANPYKGAVGDLLAYSGARDGRVWPWLKARWGL